MPGKYIHLTPPKDDRPKPNVPEAAAAGVRAASGVLPLVVRGGTGLLSGLVSAEPGLGTAAGAAIGGGGEALAQLIENGFDPSKLNKSRIAVEAGLSAVPFGKTKSVISQAAKGASLAAAGVIGRKATDENPDTHWYDMPSWWDAGQVALGGAVGGAMAKFFGPKNAANEALVSKRPYGPQTAGDYLDELRLHKPEDIAAEAARLESIGDEASKAKARGLRIAARDAKRGNERIYKDITDEGNQQIAQDAKNLNAGLSASPELPPVADVISRGPKAVEDIALRAEAAGNTAYAKELRDAAVKAGISSSTTSRAVVRGQKAAEKAAKEAQKKSAVEAARQRAIDEGKESIESYSEGVSAEFEDGTRGSTRTSFRAPQPEGDEGVPTKGAPRPKPTPPSLAPKEGVFQIIDENGKVTELADQGDVEKLLNAAGPGNKLQIVPPKVTPAAPTAPAVKTPEAVPTTPQTPSKGEPLSPTMKAILKEEADKQAAIRGTEADVPEIEGDESAKKVAAEIEKVRKTRKPKAAAPKAVPPAEAPQAPQAPVATNPIPEAATIDPERLADISERVIAKNPMTGALESGVADPSRGVLILSPKNRPGTDVADFHSGWDRMDVSPEGIKTSTTKNIKPQELGVPRAESEPLDLNAVRADLDNIQDPLVRQMAERELGILPAEAAPAATQAAATQAGKGVPQELLDRVTNFKMRQAEALRAATSQEEADAIAASFEKEANALQLELSLAERESERGAINPMLALRMALGGAGALTGAATDEDDRLRGALIGGAAGFTAPSMLGKVGNTFNNTMSLGDRLVNAQRFALLSNPINLGINTVAPIGGGVMSSLEKILAGKLGGDQKLADLGKAGLRELLGNPTQNYSSTAWRGYAEEARRLIREAESGRGDMMGKPNSALDKALAFPASLMTTGDTAARSILEKGARWTDDMAREATLTGENRYDLIKGLTNFSRSGGPLAKLLLPFVKTAGNAIEGSFERLPIFGLLATKSGTNPDLEATIAEIAARQGMGAAVSGAAYLLGTQVDPDTSRNLKLNVAIANMAGQYGPLAAAAFAAGQANITGDSPVDKGTSHFLRDLPLPTTEVADELLRAVSAYSQGEPPNPNAATPVEQWIPNNFVPRAYTFLNDVNESMNEKPKSKYIHLVP